MPQRCPRLPLLLAASLLTLAPPAAAQGSGGNPWPQRRVLHIAHAGGECEAPTNTLYAWKTALAKGADMIEFDVHTSADGVVVVIHDATVDRVTNGSGRVDAMTLVELKELDKAYDFTPHGGEGCLDEAPGNHPFRGVATGDVPPPDGFEANDFKIATLREVLETFPDVLMSIEIKGTAPGALETAERLAALLREFGRSDDVLVATFEDAVIEHFRALAPEVHTTPGLLGVISIIFGVPTAEVQAMQIPPSYDGFELATPGLVDYLHSLGLPMIVFLQEDTELESVYDELLDAGVDGVITGRPSAFEAKLQERGLAFEVPIDVAAPGASADRRGRVAVPLACPFWAGSPVCAGWLSMEWTPPGDSEPWPRSLVRPIPFEVPRGERAVLETRLGPLTRMLLQRFGPLRARVQVEPTGPLDAATETPFTLEPWRTPVGQSRR